MLSRFASVSRSSFPHASMTSGFVLIIAIAYIVAVSGSLTGCTPPAPAPKNASNDHDHDHEHDHDHDSEKEPTTYAEVVSALVLHRDLLAKEIAAKNEKKADGLVHEIGHLIEKIRPMAAKEKFTDDQLAEIKKASEQLFNDFDAVDAKFHGNKGKSFDEVADSVAKALDSLSKLAKPAAAESNGAAAKETEKPKSESESPNKEEGKKDEAGAKADESKKE